MNNLEVKEPRKLAGFVTDKNADIDTFIDNERKKMSLGEDKSLYTIRMCVVFLAVILAFAIVIIYLIHLTCPTSWRWLCQSEVTQIKDLAISIIIGLTLSIATTYFFKMKK